MSDTTGNLENQLKSVHPSQLGRFFRENKDKMAPERELNPFLMYFTERLREKKLTQRALFVRLGISESYGRKIVSGEKRARSRDLILALCLGAGFTLEETNRALKLYPMPPLYARVRRDAIIMNAVSNRVTDPEQISRLLLAQGEEALKLLHSPDGAEP